MSRPPTDRERILQLEAKNAELTAELEAYRANDRDAAANSAAVLRWAGVADRLRPHLPDRYRHHAPQTARLLIYLMDHADQLARHFDLGQAIILNEDNDAPEQSAKVAVSWARSTLPSLGLADVQIRTVYGDGWVLQRADAARLRAVLEPDA